VCVHHPQLDREPRDVPGLAKLLADRRVFDQRVPDRRPERLRREHEFDDFDCGEQQLDEWLKRYARATDASESARVFVVAEGREGRCVLRARSSPGRTSISDCASRRGSAIETDSGGPACAGRFLDSL
jgi:hypothetical protein